MDIAQSVKAGEWIRDCEGLLHPDVEKVSWVTKGAAEWLQSMVLIFHVRVSINHKRFPLQTKSQRAAFLVYKMIP